MPELTSGNPSAITASPTGTGCGRFVSLLIIEKVRLAIRPPRPTRHGQAGAHAGPGPAGLHARPFAAAYATGGLFILLGFFPKVSSLLAVMPAPVAGAVLVFSACYMIMSGLQIITSEKLDYRRTFAIGLGLFAGLSHDIVPQVYANAPDFLHPVMGSSLSFAVIVAVFLNQLLALRLPGSKSA